MQYDEALRYLHTLGRELASPQQARVQKFDLANIAVLAENLFHPELSAPCVHIAGTNGKGSTAAILESILRTSGLRTGLYTSPHLERINERIRVNGVPIPDEDFAASFTRVLDVIEREMAIGKLAAHPTFFECMTAMAFDAFFNTGVTFAIYEVGMGGRLDATNIVQPEISIITAIDFDHENFLGHSLKEIAGEKAGIIKPKVTVVSAADRAEASDVIAWRCRSQKAHLIRIDSAWRLHEVTSKDGCYSANAEWRADGTMTRLKIPLPGKFQVRNALTAATAALLLRDRGFGVSHDAIERGVSTVQWPGRLERVSERPVVYLDGAHNPSAAREIRAFLEENFAGRRVILVYGALRDKAVDEIAGSLFPRAEHVILTQPHQTRAISVDVLAQMAAHHARKCESIADPSRAIDRALALARREDVVLITGSLYLVGEARTRFVRGLEQKVGD
jgi:dihydrofolate synthase / folylpolyglutamate synthase